MAGLPPWSALPLGILSGALLIAVFGMYWDISTHLDAGRDPGPFANAAHYFILVGLFGIFFAGLVAIFLPTEKPGPTAMRLPGGLQAPLGGVLILVCSGVALAGFPLDDMWHRIFGQDVTLWGPTHLLLFGGASLSTLGAMILLMEGATAAREVRPRRVSRTVRLQQVLLGGAFLIGLSTFQGEFDYAVPQFRLVFHPILLMLASSVALVAVRIWAGKGAAIGAALFFILIRGTLTLLVSPLFGHTLLHFPLYIVEALVVEAVALRVARDKPLTLGLLAGMGIGTIGLAAEWAWSFAWWTIEWPASMLVEGVICGFVAAVGRRHDRRLHRPRAQLARDRPAAGPALRAAGGGRRDRRPARLRDADHGRRSGQGERRRSPTPSRRPTARSTSRSSSTRPARPMTPTGSSRPPGRARRGARWSRSSKKVGPGTYRNTEPLPVHGNWKTTLRLHKGFAIAGMPIYFPEDQAIPVKARCPRRSSSRAPSSATRRTSSASRSRACHRS